MIKNYFKTAWRNIKSQPLFSLINISGLSLGITCCMMIFLYVQSELSYESFHGKADRIFRITSEMHEPNRINHFAPSSSMTGSRIKANFPEVESIVRLELSSRAISFDDKKFFDNKLIWADSTLFTMFDFNLLEGDRKKALAKPYSIVLSQSTAKRYFGNSSALGKTLQLSDTIALTVTGILGDVPKNSHLVFDALLSRVTLGEMDKNKSDMRQALEQDWFNCSLYSYILLAPGQSANALEQKINTMLSKEMAEVKKNSGLWMNVRLQPLADIHLRSHLGAEYKWSTNGDILYVYIFSATAILVLLIACCNFINLSTARSLNRSKEIGLRKVIGAAQSQLVFQFLGESILISFLASLFSLLLLCALIPLFNSSFGTVLSWHPALLPAYLLVIIAVGFLAGLYPSLLMSSFSPIRSLKGTIKHSLADIILRKGLVVFQFSLAIVLIAGTVLILKQMNFIQTRNIGMNRSHLFSVPLKGPDVKRAAVMREELMKVQGVSNISLNGFNFKGISDITLLPEGKAENEITACPVFAADENFLSVHQVSLLAGRNFSASYPSDEAEAFIVNESAVKEFGWKTPENALGKKIEWAFGKSGKVIGVIKDFNYASMRENIKPLLIHIFKPWMSLLTIRIREGDTRQILSQIEKAWKQNAIESPFDYTFLDDDFNHLYRSEMQLRKLLLAFSALAILVACLGLFGLAAFAIRQRVKEIGIRRVLGSSINGIVRLLSRDFLKLVILSIIIGTPLAYYLSNWWLKQFVYQTELNWLVFAVAGGLALLVALVTVSVQAIKAATVNPVNSLRTE